jgi:hypothetical protein
VSDSVEALEPEAMEAAVRILRLLTQIELLSIDTSAGNVVVDRQRSASAWRAANRVVMAVLASDASITSVTAHMSDSADGSRIATPNDPFVARDGARAAVIRAAGNQGEISAGEATRREQRRLEGGDNIDPLDIIWSTPLHDSQRSSPALPIARCFKKRSSGRRRTLTQSPLPDPSE